MSTPVPHRILTIDDNPAIHEDFQKLLAGQVPESAECDELVSAVLGTAAPNTPAQVFDLESASQGQAGLEKVRAAVAAGRPFALAFVDVRMPPGWDGVETIEHLWKTDPDLQVVICTAYSDYSWEEMRRRLGNSDSLLVLKKPFDTVEVLQIAHALTRKWELARQVRASLQDLDRKIVDRTQALEREMAERARVEESLRQSQKLEAVGRLAAGIAHDFNNLLTVIQGHIGLLLSPTSNKLAAPDSLTQVAHAAERAAVLTRQLLVFGRNQTPQRKSLELNAIVTNSGKLLARLIGEHIDLRITLCTPPARLIADECNLEQVLMNLAVNARDAMPTGGTLTVSTSLETEDTASGRRHPQARPGRYVCLTVADTGCGMDSATLGRIFEPFFTTKEVGKGTGLGLATVYGIVQQHHGWIEVTSQLGKGTTFRVFLPHSDLPDRGSTQTERMLQPSLGAGKVRTVLLVEDEPTVREYVRMVLSANSFRVLEASDGVEALKVWSENAGQIDLLLTDMVMPNGVTGRALAERLYAEAPNLRVVFSSGYSPDIIELNSFPTGAARFLPKPYKPDLLVKSVRDCFAAPPLLAP